jgi:hypothetical protein
MAYSRKNFLERVADVQYVYAEALKKACTEKYQRAGGYSKRWIYKHVIKPRFHIGYSTFDKYLLIPAKNELEKLQNGNNRIEF